MTDTVNVENQKAGLFLLKLQSTTKMVGAPILHLNLTVDAPHDKVSGFAEVTQALADPVVCVSHVHGVQIHETVMGPGSKIRIDLSGYPYIDWPVDGGVGPMIPKNFRAMVLLDTDYRSGEVRYQYQSVNGGWVSMTQEIHEVDNVVTPRVSEVG